MTGEKSVIGTTLVSEIHTLAISRYDNGDIAFNAEGEFSQIRGDEALAKVSSDLAEQFGLAKSSVAWSRRNDETLRVSIRCTVKQFRDRILPELQEPFLHQCEEAHARSRLVQRVEQFSNQVG